MYIQLYQVCAEQTRLNIPSLFSHLSVLPILVAKPVGHGYTRSGFRQDCGNCTEASKSGVMEYFGIHRRVRVDVSKRRLTWKVTQSRTQTFTWRAGSSQAAVGSVSRRQFFSENILGDGWVGP